MRQSKTRDMMKKVAGIITDHEYPSAADIAEKCHMSVSSVYRTIRLMREDGIGVIPSKKGYVMSDHAQKQDDVHFLRKLNGQRASAFISFRAAEPHIRSRWAAVKDRENLRLLTAPLKVSESAMKRSVKVLLRIQKGKNL